MNERADALDRRDELKLVTAGDSLPFGLVRFFIACERQETVAAGSNSW